MNKMTSNIVFFILALSFNIDAADTIWQAAQKGDNARVEQLLAEGADVNEKCQTDMLRGTPLHYAALGGQCNTAEFLLNRGAQVNAESKDGGIPLHQAAYKGSPQIIALLLARGAYINARDNKSFIPVHYAAWQKHYSAAVVLVSKAATNQRVLNTMLEARTNNDWPMYGESKTAADIAIIEESQPILDLLTDQEIREKAIMKYREDMFEMRVKAERKRFQEMLERNGITLVEYLNLRAIGRKFR